MDELGLSLNNLKVVSAVGRGAKGVVFLVKNESCDEVWALKVIMRNAIEKKDKKINKSGCDDYKRVSFEQQVLTEFNHPLLPRLRGVLETDKIVGYAIDYCPGRDLNCLRKKQTEKMFSDDIIRFYAAELVLALEHLHNLGIVYRDLKPENIMIQENGHIMLVDFDLSTKLSLKSLSPRSALAKPNVVIPSPPIQKQRSRSPFLKWCNWGISQRESGSASTSNSRPSPHSVYPTQSNSEKSNSFVGTEEYVAPEIIEGNGHDFAVDWWSLGVVLYEMLYGRTPFRGSNRKETFYRILSKEPELVGETTALRDLIRKLLEKDPRRRTGVEEIKGHDFFRGLEWDRVVEIPRPPYIPHFDEGEEIEGNKGISDVEVFVQGMCGCEESEKNKDVEKKISVDDSNKEDGKANKKVWTDGLNDHSSKTNDFLVF